MTPGKFIVIESTCDGAGKSTLATSLEAVLTDQGIPVQRTFEVGDASVIGPTMRQFLLNPDRNLAPLAELFIVLADRAQHVKDMRDWLAQGLWVISDRFTLSTLAYQGASRAFDPEFLRDITLRSQSGLIPHMTLLLDIPVQVMRDRLQGEKDFFERQGDAYFERVRRGYFENIHHPAVTELYQVIDATQPPALVLNEALRVLSGLSQGQIQPFGTAA